MKYYVTINDKRYEVEVEKGDAAIVSTTEIAQAVMEKQTSINRKTAVTTITPEIIELAKQTVEDSSAREIIKAPMAGGITNVKVSVGSAVKIGDTLLLLEAMKMENEITSHVDGTVAEIKVAKGTSVSANDILMVIK